MFGPLLKGAHVTLRPGREEDADHFVRWFADTEVTRYHNRRMAVALYQEQEFLKKIGESKDDVWWMIDAQGKAIGAAGTHLINWLDANAMTGIIIGGVGAFLYFPRGGPGTPATNAATLAILNTTIDGSRAGAAFAPALDGEIYATGDLVRANVDGRAVLTFFDASSLSVDPGSQVKVIALNRLPSDGIQVTIEQTLGRSWSSVQKLKTPDSKFEIKTPSTTAVVPGPAVLPPV